MRLECVSLNLAINSTINAVYYHKIAKKIIATRYFLNPDLSEKNEEYRIRPGAWFVVNTELKL